MKRNKFIDVIKVPAMNAMKEHGLLASVTMAQAALESGWLSSDLYEKANNPFGIKGEYNGEFYEKESSEFKDGKEIKELSKFRKYPDLKTAIDDRTYVLLNAKNGKEYRYKSVVGVTDPEEAIKIIYNGGYATDPEYVSKIMNIIKTNNFTKYDNEVIKELEKESTENDVVDNIIEVDEKDTVNIYRVRLDYNNPNTQIGAFAELNRAISLVDKNPDYKVFNINGDIVYEVKKKEEVKEEIVEEVGKPVLKEILFTGKKLNIKDAGLYTSSTASKPIRRVKNLTLYIYDGIKFNTGKYRVCINKSLCNKGTSNVYGYIDITDCELV